MSDEYLDLITAARDAMGDLLRATKPGWLLDFHRVYRELDRTVEGRAVRAAAPSTRQEDRTTAWLRVRHDEWEAARVGWTRLSKSERERLISETLSEDRLTVRELIDRLASEPDRSNLYYRDVYVSVRALFVAGELDRKSELVRSRTQYRYFRKALEGPIADLDRVYRDESRPEGEATP